LKAVLVLGLLAWGCGLAHGDEAEGLTAGLKQHYKFATAKLGSNGYPQLVPGTVLTVETEGIVSFGEQDASYAELCPSEFQGGGLRAPRTTLCTLFAPESRRVLRVSETVCVTALNVEAKLDTVAMFLATCGPGRGSVKAEAYHALVNFRFPKGSLAGMTASRVEQAIGQVLSEVDREEPDPAKAEKDEGMEEATRPIAPPPPPVAEEPNSGDAASRTPATPNSDGTGKNAQVDSSGVAKGQTTEQVVAILGPPNSVADLGRKRIYFYPNLKVIFADGKVSEIQRI
jgi:hypothetical protein